MELNDKNKELDWRAREKWTIHEVESLNILKKYKIPSRDVGRILLRSPKAVRMKLYHLKKKK